MTNRISHAPALRRKALLLLLPVLTVLVSAYGQSLSGTDLVHALRKGGYVIVMRHASSPRTPPDPAQANSDNVQHERQLDEAGRSSALAMGEALRRLRIPIGQVLSSPTYRALETVRLARLGEAKTYSQLGDSGQSMQADLSGERAGWLRARSADTPPAGTNTIIVTHFPNVTEAFAERAAGLADGEALIFHADGRGSAPLVARVKIEEWPRLAASH
jgi:phosphohistidine phosphatase SixA